MAVVPYKDQASSLLDLMSGRVDVTISGATAVVRKMSEVHMSQLGSGMTPRQIAGMFESEVKLWEPVLRDSGLKFQ